MHIILNSFGTSLQKENGIFSIHNADGKQAVYPDKVKSISISKGAKISSDAALLAIEHEIDVLFIDGVGKPVGRIWSVKYGSVSTIRRNQIDFSMSPQSVEWIKDVIIQKIDNQSALLMSLRDEGSETENRLNALFKKFDVYKQKIRNAEAVVVNDIAPMLRGWEGAASKSYFSEINMLLPESMKFEQRSAHPARDVFNMLLNYGYGMLYGKIEGALIKAGIDPYMGILHRDDYNRPVLAFDVIELYRVWIDYVVVSLARQEVFNEDCYSVKEGVYWLESQGKRILIQSVNDYLEEIVKMNGMSRSRAVHIDLFAQNLAQKFLKFSNNRPL